MKTKSDEKVKLSNSQMNVKYQVDIWLREFFEQSLCVSSALCVVDKKNFRLGVLNHANAEKHNTICVSIKNKSIHCLNQNWQRFIILR